MPLAETSKLSLPEAAILAGVIAVGVAVWAWIAAQEWHGRRLVRWEPRRPVPWHGFHVLILVVIYLGLSAGLATVMADRSGVQPAAGPPTPPPHTVSDHPVERLLREGRDPATILLCVLTAGVLAPLCEEFLFRLVLQGWLQAKELRLRRRLAVLRRWPAGLLSVVFVALLFSAFHVRGTKEEEPALDLLWWILLATAAANLLTLVLGILLLRLDAGATSSDLGLAREKLGADIRMGLWAFAAIAPVVYPLNGLLGYLMDGRFAPDPISLVPFSLLVGTLYARTHRIVPSIVVHMALNCTSLLLVLLWPGL